MADVKDDSKDEVLPTAEVDDSKDDVKEDKKDNNDNEDEKDDVKVNEHPERIPKEDPGDGLPTKTPDFFTFKWKNTIKKKDDCDTLHMLYLLSLSLELVRKRTIERNKYFKSIGRTDRFINHLDAPQVMTNFLDWHNKDKEKNKFDGALLKSAEKLYMINTMISEVGGMKKGPATKVFTKLKKDVTILFNVWTDLPQPELKIENWGGYDQLYKGELKLEECSFEQMVTLLTYVNPLPTPEEEKDADPSDKYKNFPQGVLEFIARKSAKKGNPSHLQKEPDWRKKIVDWWIDSKMDGKAFTTNKLRPMAQKVMDTFIPPTVLNDKGKPINTKLRAGAFNIFRELQKVYVHGVLTLAAEQGQLYVSDKDAADAKPKEQADEPKAEEEKKNDE